jgi:hypothetical protein
MSMDPPSVTCAEKGAIVCCFSSAPDGLSTAACSGQALITALQHLQLRLRRVLVGLLVAVALA